jgi:hypothetical protein
MAVCVASKAMVYSPCDLIVLVGLFPLARMVMLISLMVCVCSCKGNLTGALSMDGNSQRSPPTELPSPVAAPGLVILNKPYQRSGPTVRAAPPLLCY